VFHEAEIVAAALDGVLDWGGEAGETVYERRDGSQGPAGVSEIAGGEAGVVVGECDDLLGSDETRGEKRRAAVGGEQDEVHLSESGEVVQERGGPERTAAVERIRGFGGEHQNLHETP
jgi:hypothetical protein